MELNEKYIDQIVKTVMKSLEEAEATQPHNLKVYSTQ